MVANRLTLDLGGAALGLQASFTIFSRLPMVGETVEGGVDVDDERRTDSNSVSCRHLELTYHVRNLTYTFLCSLHTVAILVRQNLVSRQVGLPSSLAQHRLPTSSSFTLRLGRVCFSSLIWTSYTTTFHVSVSSRQ